MGPIGILPQEPVNIWQFESPSPTYMTEDGEHAIIAKPENAEAEHFYRRAIVVSTAYGGWPAPWPGESGRRDHRRVLVPSGSAPPEVVGHVPV